jgi:CubicO group peptidase (beta-lactamase class C family)
MLNSTENISIEEVVNKLAALPLVHDPGEAFTYGLHTDIVGRLVEVISGKPLDVFIRERIFDPLGMKDSYFYLPEDKKDRLVTLYEKPNMESKLVVSAHRTNQDFPVAGHTRYFSGGAGLVGTIEDYGRFCLMLVNGGEFNGHRILGKKTIEMMTTNQIGDLNVWKSSNKFGLGFEYNRKRCCIDSWIRRIIQMGAVFTHRLPDRSQGRHGMPCLYECSSQCILAVHPALQANCIPGYGRVKV